MSAASTARDLRAAADVIRSGGLLKNSYEMNGRHCTVGALRHVTETGELDEIQTPMHDQDRVNAAMTVLGGLLGATEEDMNNLGICTGPGFTAITTWNDRNETTPADVITLLEQAAEKLEAEL